MTARGRTLHVAIYGDIDLNLIDGSAIWLQSIAHVFARHPNARITILLKAPIRRDLLVRPLRTLERVRLLDPFADRSQRDLKHSLSPNQVAKLLVEMDGADRIDILVVRGRRAVAKMVENGSFDGRLWPYLTDIPQSPGQLTPQAEAELGEIARASRYILCQTEELRSFLEAWLPGFAGKAILCPPIIPVDHMAAAKEGVPAQRKPKLVYIGKFAPAWNALEIVGLPAAFVRAGTDIELHAVGDKIHDVADPPDFAASVRRGLSRGAGVIWHGGKSRDDAMALAAACDFGLSWRRPEMDRSLELSTKVLEYGSLGLPVLLNRTTMHEDLLGRDYPLFVTDETDVVDAVRAALADPALYRLAAERCAQAAKGFTYDAVYTRLLPYLEREFPQTPVAAAPMSRPLRVVVASHDLKFFTRIQEHLERVPGIELRLDAWTGLREHDPAQSTECLAWADAIICEWCGANAVWYSRHKQAQQKLYVRLHRFEINTEFPRQMEIGSVDRVICVSEHYRRLVRDTFGWPDAKVITIANWVDIQQFDRPKFPGAALHLGMIGIAPARKRIDRALDILERLRGRDARYMLFVKTKMPWEYWWIWQNKEEQAYFEEVFARINSSPHLRDAVVFDPFGADVALWLRKIGFVLSTSDDESFHLAPAEGMASGAVPMVLNWPGAETIYAEQWIRRSTDEIADSIGSMVSDGSWASQAREARDQIEHRYALETICAQWTDLVFAA